MQLDKTSHGYIARNKVVNKNGGTAAEDHISIYKSGGTQGSPLVIENNDFNGGGPRSLDLA